MYDTLDGKKTSCLVDVSTTTSDRTEIRSPVVKAVTFCKDCVYRKTTFCKFSFFVEKPYEYNEWTKDYDFCSYGKEK